MRTSARSLFQVKVEGRTQFLSAVCMSCLEGSGGQPVRCRCCTQPWDGSSLVLGTMYSYDIFAAMPCCTERLKVNSLVSRFSNRSRTYPPFVEEIIASNSIFSVLSRVPDISIATNNPTKRTDLLPNRWDTMLKLRET